MKKGIVIIPLEDSGDGCGFFVFAAIVIVVALLLVAVTGGFTWLMMGVCCLTALLEEISWIWGALIAGVLMVVQVVLASAGRDDLSGPILGSALIVDLVMSLILTVVFSIMEGFEDGWLAYVIGIPFLTLIFALMLYPMASLVTTVTALPTVFINWRYALGSVCGFLIMIGLVLALQGALEGVCSVLSEDLWEMTRLQFTGKWLMLNVTDNAQAMRIGQDAAVWLSQMSAGWRFLVFSVVAVLSVWGRIAVASDDL